MAMRRTRRGNSKQNHRIDENWTVKSSHDHTQDHHQQQQQEQNSNLPKQQNFETKPYKTQRDPKWVSHNRSKHASKQCFVKKSELINSKSQLGSSTSEVSSLNSEVGAPQCKQNSTIDVDSSSFCGKAIEELGKKEGDGLETKQGECENSGDGFEPENGVDDAASRLGELQLGVEGPYDIVSRLMELQFGAEEGPELSEEQLRTNDQLQVDELLALESIYGDNAIILDTQSGLRCFQIHIHIDTPRGLTVTAMLNTSGDLKMKSKNEDGFSYSFKVQYLPPIVLTCLLPKSYPSLRPPYFMISVQWLDSIKISDLCSMLDSLWMQQYGQEVVFQWTDWLQNFSLSHLGIDNEIMLGPYGIKHAGDRRAISGSVSLDVDIPSLKSYSEKQCQEKFRQSLHECCICYIEYAGSDFIRLPCQHFFCLNCIKTYSNIHISEGTVNKLHCPEEKCRGMIPPGLLKQLLGEKEYERWESLLLQKTLDSMSDVAYCPRCETPCITDEDQHAQCSKCFFSFCTLCWQRRHVGESCLTPELRLRILEGRQNSSMLNSEQQRKERGMINELLSVKEILRDAKQCPTCNMAISRTAGCNKMVCGNCGQYFCYRCNHAIDGYDHYRDGECELFPQDELQQWEQQMNALPVIAGQQMNARMMHANQEWVPSPCPYCAQLNAKINNNNHILCWACRRHYCHLCRLIVKRSSEHYGPKGCKQHSSG